MMDVFYINIYDGFYTNASGIHFKNAFKININLNDAEVAVYIV